MAFIVGQLARVEHEMTLLPRTAVRLLLQRVCLQLLAEANLGVGDPRGLDAVLQLRRRLEGHANWTQGVRLRPPAARKPSRFSIFSIMTPPRSARSGLCRVRGCGKLYSQCSSSYAKE
eukprot:scaffold14746_cov124-Isochrysis_galbana.AAC.2